MFRLFAKLIRINSYRRVASTRMMEKGEMLMAAFPDWRNRLIINWSEEEKKQVASQLGVAMNECQIEDRQ
jgi:hypothetical protein